MIRYATLRVRTRLSILMSTLVAAFAVMLVVYIPNRLHDQGVGAARLKAASMAELAAFSVSPALLFDDRVSAADSLAGLRRQPDVIDVVVLDNSGHEFVRRSNPLQRAVGAAEYTIGRPIMNGSTRLGELRVTVSLAHLESELNANRRTTGTFSALIFALGLIATFTFSTLVTKPLSQITETARAISSGDLTRRADTSARNEIGSLARAFNDMVDSVEHARGQLESLNRDLETKVEQRTREVRAEADERRQLAREMRLLLESTYDGILATSSSGVTTLINTSALALLGFTQSQVVGIDVHTLLHRQICEGRDCELEGALVDSHLHSISTNLVRADGTLMLADISIAPVIDNGNRTGSVITFRDITESETLRSQLAESERMSSLGRLAAMMAHEFNNVLMGIQPFVEIIKRSVPEVEAVSDGCRSISQSVRRGKRVTEEILRYTRPREPILVPLEVAHWLKELCAVLRVTVPPTIDLVTELPENPVTVHADREQIEQVLTNLVSNARDAMPEGGRITIHVIQVQDDVIFEVADTGTGIGAETMDRLFEPFFTTKRTGGTGLGLAIAKQIVVRHKGAIDVQSTPGAGTTFRIRLPIGRSTAPAAAPSASPSLAQPRRVLLVEDDDVVASGISQLLQMMGQSVQLARTGTAAIESVRRSAPDVIVLDIGLPDISGVTVFDQIARFQPELPVIFSSGHADASKLTPYLQRPNVSFLLKPYTIEDLLEKMAQMPARNLKLVS